MTTIELKRKIEALPAAQNLDGYRSEILSVLSDQPHPDTIFRNRVQGLAQSGPMDVAYALNKLGLTADQFEKIASLAKQAK